MSDKIEGYLGITKEKKKSRMPAKLDFYQSATGVVLALFIAFHLIFESSILIGKDAMMWMTKMFELDFIIEGGTPVFITLLAMFIFTVFIIHAGLAMRKFPSSYREYMRFIESAKNLKHPDTDLWFLQIITGFIMFFIGSVHLYIIMTQPGNVGPYLSSDRIYSDMMWPGYLVLMVSVVIHASVGVYRLIIKWGWLDFDNPKANRAKNRKIIKIVAIFYLIIGALSLMSYMKIGYEHRDHYGERYIGEHK